MTRSHRSPSRRGRVAPSVDQVLEIVTSGRLPPGAPIYQQAVVLRWYSDFDDEAELDLAKDLRKTMGRPPDEAFAEQKRGAAVRMVLVYFARSRKQLSALLQRAIKLDFVDVERPAETPR